MLLTRPKRHREVLIRRYGLNNTEIESHGEISEWLGVGEGRSRQLIDRVVGALPRAALEQRLRPLLAA